MDSICLINPKLAPIGPPTLKPTLLERVLLVLLLWVWLRVLQLLWRVRVTPFALNWLSSLWVQLPCDWLWLSPEVRLRLSVCHSL